VTDHACGLPAPRAAGFSRRVTVSWTAATTGGSGCGELAYNLVFINHPPRPLPGYHHTNHDLMMIVGGESTAQIVHSWVGDSTNG